MSGGPKLFSEVIETPECLCTLKILLYGFQKTLGVPGGPKHFSEIVEALESLLSL